jgi:hypothetical protein
LKAKFKPWIIGFIVLACITLVCADAMAGLTLMRIHEKAGRLKLLLSAFNIFGVFVGCICGEALGPRRGNWHGTNSEEIKG